MIGFTRSTKGFVPHASEAADRGHEVHSPGAVEDAAVGRHGGLRGRRPGPLGLVGAGRGSCCGRPGGVGQRQLRVPDGRGAGTVNPSLWRQSALVAKQGLFEVVEGIYQVRGLDLSNMTIVEGDTGVIVIDPLISTETAAAALALYREHRGDRPVTAVIYTHATSTTSAASRGHHAGRRRRREGPGRRSGGLHRARGRGERLRGHGDDPTRRLHVRRGARTGPAGPDRRRPRADRRRPVRSV